jgi:hypothetical protein
MAVTERQRTPSNVPGPFYVAKDECITCGAPEADAPSLIRHDEEHGSCYFYRQPENADDTYHALRAMAVCCVSAVRYAGTDPVILQRAAAVSATDQCDHPVRAQNVVPRTHVTFQLDGSDVQSVLESLAAALATTTSYITVTRSAATRIAYAYGAKTDVDVTVRRSEDGAGRWLAMVSRRHYPTRAHSGGPVDDALRSMPGVSDLRWYTAEEYRGRRRQWAPYPI